MDKAGFYFVSRDPLWSATTVMEVLVVRDELHVQEPGDPHYRTIPEFLAAYPDAVWDGPIELPSLR